MHYSYEWDFTLNLRKYYKWVGCWFSGQYKPKAFIFTLLGQVRPRFISRDENTHILGKYIKRFLYVPGPGLGVYRKVWSKRRKLEAFTLHYTTLHIRIIKIRTLFSFWSTLRRLYHNWALSCIYPPDAGKYGRRLNTISRRNSH